MYIYHFSTNNRCGKCMDQRQFKRLDLFACQYFFKLSSCFKYLSIMLKILINIYLDKKILIIKIFIKINL